MLFLLTFFGCPTTDTCTDENGHDLCPDTKPTQTCVRNKAGEPFCYDNPAPKPAETPAPQPAKPKDEYVPPSGAKKPLY